MKVSRAYDIGPLVPGGEAITLALDVHLPARPAMSPRLLFCVPGGGVRRGYFDLQGDAGFSFAQAMTEAGHVVAAIDPAGVGESTRPADGFVLTAEVCAEGNHRALSCLRAETIGGIALGDLPIIGGGHSAGAMIAAVHQARHRDFDAMLLFCFGTIGLPEMLDEEHRAALATPDRGRSRIVEFARARFAGAAYIPAHAQERDTPAGRALRAVHDQVVSVIGAHAMTPGNVAAELALLDVPLLLAVGDRDMTGPPHLLPADYPACRDLTLYVVKGSGHHVFVAPGAANLFRRTAHWLGGLSRDDR